MKNETSAYLALAQKVTDEFQRIPCVQAIVLGGSQTDDGTLDHHSDIDLYIYASEVVPLITRQNIVKKLGVSKADLNLTFWDLGDEWYDRETGIEVDIIYWDPAWIEAQLEQVVLHHQASLGYTTCFWRTVLNANCLFDRHGWFEKFQEKYNIPYPEQLKQAIIIKNHPVLRAVIPSYYGQIKKAIDRRDLISINHRLTAFFTSYFDVLFALNELLNPGEKKLMAFTLAQCTKLPVDFQQQVENSLQSAAVGEERLLLQLDELVDGLDDLLAEEGFEPASPLSS